MSEREGREGKEGRKEGEEYYGVTLLGGSGWELGTRDWRLEIGVEWSDNGVGVLRGGWLTCFVIVIGGVVGFGKGEGWDLGEVWSGERVERWKTTWTTKSTWTGKCWTAAREG